MLVSIILLLAMVDIPMEKSIILLYSSRGKEMMMVSFDKKEMKAFKLQGSTPDLSPDGRRIAFADSGAIHIMDVNGKVLKRITVEGGMCTSPDWSPDGRKVIFGVLFMKEKNTEIFEADVETGKVTRLTFTQETEFSPRWMPDGKRILFASGRGIPDFLRLLDVATGKAEDITPKGLLCCQPYPSPDGGSVVFLGVSGAVKYGVFVMDLKSGEVKRVTEKERCRSPIFSPDGRMVMYQAEGAVWVKDLEGGEERVFLEKELLPSSWGYPLYRYGVSPK
mgnify:CR=1 FL=1